MKWTNPAVIARPTAPEVSRRPETRFPESLPQAVLRLTADDDRGYVLVHGAEGVGPAALRGLLVPGDLGIARLAAPGGAPLPGSLWLQELDAALRESEGDVAAPAPEFARSLASGDVAPERQAFTWLAALARRNEFPVLLVVDGLHAWPQSADFWPETLPENVYLVLCGRPDRFDETLTARLDSLVLGGAPLIRLGEEPAEDQHEDASPLRLADPVVAARFREASPDLYREACRELARWGMDLESGSPTWEAARDGLWRWIADCGDVNLAVKAARSDALAARMEACLQALSQHRPVHALRLATSWHEALLPLIRRDVPLLGPESAIPAALWRGDVLLRLGAFTEAWQVAQQAASSMAGQPPGFEPLHASALVLRGQAALKRDMVSAAVEDCTRAVELCDLAQLRPDRPITPLQMARARHALGQALLAGGSPAPASLQFEQAIVLFRSVGASQDLPDLYQELAALALQAGSPAQAEARCSQALELLRGGGSAQEAACLVRRAKVRSRMGRREGAIQDLQDAVALHRPLVDGGRVDLAASAAQAHHDLGSLLAGEDALRHLGEALRLGHVAVDEGRQSASRVLLARSYNERGLLHMRQGDSEAAVQDCTRAIDLGTELLERERRPQLRADLARAHNNRAQALLRRGEPELALRDYERAVGHYDNLITRQRRTEFRRHLALVHHNKGGVCRGRGDFANAHREYTKSIDVLGQLAQDHASPEILRDLATSLANRALTSGARGETNAALADFDHAVSLLTSLTEPATAGVSRDLAAALQGRARVRATASRFEEAVEDLTEALVLSEGADPEIRAALRMDRGRDLLAMGRFQPAADDFAACLDLWRSGAALALAWAERGRALAGLDRLEEARRAFDESLARLGPDAAVSDRVQVLHARGMVRWRLEGAEAAMEDLDEAARGCGNASGTERWLTALRNDRCRVYLHRGLREEALAEAERAIAELGRLQSETSEAAGLLAESLALRGRAAQGLGRVGEALVDLTRSIAAFSRLAEDARDLEMCAALAEVYRDRANAHRSVGDNRNAIFDYGWAVDLFRELWSRHGRAELEGDLAAVCAARGILLLDEDRLDEAVMDLHSAAALGLRAEAGSGRDLEKAIRHCEEHLEDR